MMCLYKGPMWLILPTSCHHCLNPKSANLGHYAELNPSVTNIEGGFFWGWGGLRSWVPVTGCVPRTFNDFPTPAPFDYFFLRTENRLKFHIGQL